MLRSLVIGQLAKYDDPSVIAEAKKKFEGHVSGSNPLSADLRTPVFSASLANGDEGTFKELMKVQRNPTMHGP
jgi:hypothetical protein